MESIAFCFDLDGTVTTEEILPLLARELDLFDEISLLTQLTMNGQIPFQSSFKLRVKILSTIPIQQVKSIIQNVKLDPSISQFIRNNKKDCFIVTGNLDVWVEDLIRQKLGCAFYCSTAIREDHLVKGIGNILDKSTAILELKKKYSKIITIGDGMNDCAMFELANEGIAYSGVHPPVESLVKMSSFVATNSSSLVHLLHKIKDHAS